MFANDIKPVKSTMPLFTVLLTRVIFDQKQTLKIYLSLIPIIAGVGIATITELSFDVIGLAAALASTCGSSLQNIFSKKVLTDTGVHPLRLLHVLGKLSLMMFFPVWLVCDGYHMHNNQHLVAARRPVQSTALLLFVDGTLAWLQNIVAFTIINEVTPLTYAVANASKRVAIILVSLVIMKNPVTPFNVAGMLLAVLGVLSYNKAKYDANLALKKQALLPTTVTVTNGITPRVKSHLHQIHPAYSYDYSRRPSAVLSNRGKVSSSSAAVANGHATKPSYLVNGSAQFVTGGEGRLPQQNGRTVKIHKNSFTESHDGVSGFSKS